MWDPHHGSGIHVSRLCGGEEKGELDNMLLGIIVWKVGIQI